MRDVDTREKLLQESAEHYEGLLNSMREQYAAGNVRDSYLDQFRYSVFSLELELFRTRYSLGENLAALLNQLESLIGVYSESTKTLSGEIHIEQYFKSLSLVSLAYLFDISHQSWVSLKESCRRTVGIDALVNMLFSSSGFEEADVSVLAPKEYLAFYEAAKQVDGFSLFLHQYLKSWYSLHKNCYWYESHKRPNVSYSGYWSFESAAFVKLLGIDASAFFGSEYFPKDLIT